MACKNLVNKSGEGDSQKRIITVWLNACNFMLTSTLLNECC